MAAWLFKTEPSEFSFDDLRAKQVARWDGVKNATALIHLRSVKPGDTVVIYHTGNEKRAVGLAKVVRAPYPDPAHDDPKLVVVDLEAGAALAAPVPLAAFRADPLLGADRPHPHHPPVDRAAHRGAAGSRPRAGNRSRALIAANRVWTVTARWGMFPSSMLAAVRPNSGGLVRIPTALTRSVLVLLASTIVASAASAQDATAPTEKPPHVAGSGFRLVTDPNGTLNFKLLGMIRYLNQTGIDDSYTDAFGNTKRVDPRQDIQFNKLDAVLRRLVHRPAVSLRVVRLDVQREPGPVDAGGGRRQPAVEVQRCLRRGRRDLRPAGTRAARRASGRSGCASTTAWSPTSSSARRTPRASGARGGSPPGLDYSCDVGQQPEPVRDRRRAARRQTQHAGRAR